MGRAADGACGGCSGWGARVRRCRAAALGGDRLSAMAKRKKKDSTSEKVAARRAARKAAAAQAADPKLRRSFQGLPGEADWVAMREVIPAATAQVRATGEYGDRDVTIATVLPGMIPAMHREDGAILIALQTRTNS